MIQVNKIYFKNIDRLYDSHEISLPSANNAERLHFTCLIKAGSSGKVYLGSGEIKCIPE